MRNPIKPGSSVFRTVREKGYHYVDKSNFILEILEREDVLLIPRPRRFGKTLNLTMLHAFFDQAQSSGPLFEGLAVARVPAAMAHLNGYPTLYLTFKDMAYPTWDLCEKDLKARVSELVRVHKSILLNLEDPIKQEQIQALYAQTASFNALNNALSTLIQCLHEATGKKVVVLIDEYDNPVHEAHAHGYLTEILDFMRNFLGSALKDSPYLERAVITGILRIAKESIYSGLNNLGVYTLLDPEFASCFGFTEAEVHHLLVSCDLADRETEVRAWYNGYRFGDLTIYNPWSILKMASRPNVTLQDYWLKTSGNSLVRELILSGKAIQLEEVEALLLGQSVRKRIDTNIAIRDVSPESAWSLLLFSGYLTAINYDSDTSEADLFIPNREVARFFQQTIRTWLGPSNLSQGLVDTLLAGEIKSFTKYLAESITTILSYHDTAGKQPEKIYHVLVIGLLAQLSGRYTLLSNRESGGGRPDLALIPRALSDPGFIFEFKAAANAQTATLTATAHAALNQAFARDYAAQFRQAGVVRLTTIGLACHGKRVALAHTTQSLPDGSPSKTELQLEGPEPKKPKRPTNRPQAKQAPKPIPSAQKVKDAHHIQQLQQQRGYPITPLEYLLEQDTSVLETTLNALRN